MKRNFENKKSDKKTQALQLWRENRKVVEIAKSLQVTRATVYRWIEGLDKKLSEPDRRSRLSIDVATKSRILELYVLLKKPSMMRLSEALDSYFHIRLSPHQLSRYLKRWGWNCFSPSALFGSVCRERFQSNNEFGATRAEESFQKPAGGSSDQAPLDLHSG